MKYFSRIAAGIGLCILCLFLFLNANLIGHFDVLNGMGEFSYPSYLWISEAGDKYFIDDSLTQVLVLDKDGQYKFEINGGTTSEKGFNFVNNVIADEQGYIYITDVRYNASYDRDARYRILKYTPNGTFDSVLYDYTYKEDDMPYIHSSLMSIEYKDKRLYYAQRKDDSFQLFSIAADGTEEEPVLEKQVSYEDAELMVVDFAFDISSKNIYISNKKGDIFNAAGQELELIYDGGNYNEEFAFYEVPYEITLNEDASKLFFTDIGTREIYALDLETLEKTVVHKNDDSLRLDEQELYYRVTSVEGGQNAIAFCCSNGSYYIYENGTLMENECAFTYDTLMVVRFVFTWIGVLLLAGLVLYAFVRFFIYTFYSEKGDLIRTYLFIFVAIAIMFVTVTNILINDTGDRYAKSSLSNTYSLSKLSADLIDGDILERIEGPDDYMNEDYQIIREQVQSAYQGNTDDIDATYCVLYKLKNNVVYYTFSLSDDYGIIYPDELAYEDSDYIQILETGEPVVYSEIETGDGEWMYTTSPVYNSKGELVAVCEVGKNKVTYDQQNNEMLLEVLIRVGSLTVIIFLAFYELIHFINVLKEKMALPKTESYNAHLLVDFTRIFSFVIYAADNLTSVIIPIMSQQLYQKESGIPESIAIALPLASQSFAMAVTGFAAGHVIHKIGNRKTFIMGILLHIVGLALCGMSSNIPVFSAAMLIVGMGMGTNTVCLNSYIVARKEEEEKSRGFSMLTAGMFAGTNCGVIIGTILSEEYSYSVVFYISALIAVLVLVLVFALYKKDYVSDDLEISMESEDEESLISLPRFLIRLKVVGFFLFGMTPYIIFASFVFYFLPIFASGEGVSESKIGIITLVYGIAASYLSPALTKLIVERFGAKKSLIAASILTMLSLGLFLISPTIASLVIIVLVMGVADSFGYPAISMYFSELPEVKAYGENKSLGVYSVFDGMAQTIAPFIFSAALAFGTGNGIMVIGIGFACCITLFTITSMRLSGSKRI